MATEASAPPQVFARKATGLRREASARDVFIYNTNNQNVGIGVTFMVLLIPALYAGGSMVTATILAGLLALPMAGVYAYFAAAMPRSGGDYIYISRTLHPFLGFLSSWNWVVWLVTYTGIPAAYLAQYGLSGLCRELGYVFDSPTLVGYGDNFSRKWWIFVAGSLLLTFFADRLRARDAALLPHPDRDVRDRDDRRRRRPRHPRDPQPDRHRERLQLATSPGWAASTMRPQASTSTRRTWQQSSFDLKQTLYAMVWPLFITLYAITSSFIGGEVRNAKRSQFIGMPGSIVYVTIFMLLLVLGLNHAVGTTFLGRLGYPLPQDVPSVLGIGNLPTYNEVIATMVRNQGWLVLLLGRVASSSGRTCGSRSTSSPRRGRSWRGRSTGSSRASCPR